jgi:enamine deaminase RidA (YjgF/YER057c/UK114 family)
MKALLPPGWPRPSGYSNGIAARGRLIFTAGVVGWDSSEHFVSENMVGQFRQVLLNTLAILKEGGAGPEHIVRMTWYVTSRDEYVRDIKQIGAVYGELMGKCFPTMAVVQVAGLVDPAARIEIESIAVVPDE